MCVVLCISSWEDAMGNVVMAAPLSPIRKTYILNEKDNDIPTLIMLGIMVWGFAPFLFL